jgi:hypothetical protein
MPFKSLSRAGIDWHAVRITGGHIFAATAPSRSSSARNLSTTTALAFKYLNSANVISFMDGNSFSLLIGVSLILEHSNNRWFSGSRNHFACGLSSLQPGGSSPTIL